MNIPNIKIETVKINDRDVRLYYLSNPMNHQDWHDVEDHGLVYVKYIHEGPDYWDDQLLFCKEENKEDVEKWLKQSIW